MESKPSIMVGHMIVLVVFMVGLMLFAADVFRVIDGNKILEMFR